MKFLFTGIALILLLSSCGISSEADSPVDVDNYPSMNCSDYLTDGIDIFFERPSGWSEAWIWYDKDSDDIWETTSLAQSPGDMQYVRTVDGKDWYVKSVSNTSSVTFLFNNGTWSSKVADSSAGGADFVSTADVWVRSDGSSYASDPVGGGTDITIYFEKPSSWSNVFVWYDKDSDDVWETTTLASPPGDMTWYRNVDGKDWYSKKISSTSSVTFLFNDGSWNNKIAEGQYNSSDFVATADIWVRADRSSYSSDPVGGNDITISTLGAEVSSTKTTFAIWSPDSSNVQLKVDGTTYDCERIQDQNGYSGIYGIELEGDFHLSEYQFFINNKAVRDPYGKMVKNEAGTPETYYEKVDGVNHSVTSDYGSMVNIAIDTSRVNLPGGWSARPALSHKEKSIIYELHVRDFTIGSNSGVSSQKKGKFLGLVEDNTSYNGAKTGLAHLKEMGITHVQIMPPYDFGTKVNHGAGDTDYNWGYDPVNYNVPEERYSLNPSDYEYRMREFKLMVDEFHKNGIRVIIDVVYNHSFDTEMFEDISMRYYTPTDLSGCTNSIDTGEAMVSRMIRDSLEYWIEEYNVDGFRFDLMGIYRTDAMKSWGEYLNAKYADRKLLLYGEPWCGGSEPQEWSKVRLGKMPTLNDAGIAAFNDQFRQAVKGSSDNGAMGYMFNETYGGRGSWDIMIGSRGSLTTSYSTDSVDTWSKQFALDPEQTINYITAHDNLCLTDKITAAGKSGAYAERINRFGNGIILTSQGIAFIHSGAEFLRSKEHGPYEDHAHNSYMWGDECNMVRWEDKVSNINTFNYYKDMIDLRKNNAGLTLTSWHEINNRMRSYTDGRKVISEIDQDNNMSNGYELVVVYNPEWNYTVNLPSGSWTKVFDIDGYTNKTDRICEGTAVTVFRKN